MFSSSINTPLLAIILLILASDSYIQAGVLSVFATTTQEIRKCSSHSDCDTDTQFCLDMKCVPMHLKVRCRDNEDCNVVAESDYQSDDTPTTSAMWLKCMKDADEEFGHCQPSSTRYIDTHLFGSQTEHQDQQHLAEVLRGDADSADSNTPLPENATPKQTLLHYMTQISTLHFPICKLLKHTSPSNLTTIGANFLHWYHEAVFGGDDEAQRHCGSSEDTDGLTTTERLVAVSENQMRESLAPSESIAASPSTSVFSAYMDDPNIEDRYPVPMCGYGICDNPDFRKQFFSYDQIMKDSQQTRLVFLHFHVFPTVQNADARIAATVRRMNEFYRAGKILFLAFVSNYNGKYTHAKLARQHEISDCARTIGALNCVLDEEVIEDIYGSEWRNRGSFHVLIGNLYLPALLGWSHFPWQNLHGLLTIADHELNEYSTTLPHELGHAVGGLHHVFRGREQVSRTSSTYSTNQCHACVEEKPSDLYGDLTADTNPTPEFFECRNPTVQERPDMCNKGRIAWVNTPFSNLMSYAPSSCHTHFTQGQFERMHCWISQYRNAYHLLTPSEEKRLQKLQVEECYTQASGVDYRGRFDDFGACKEWPSEWWSAEWGIIPGDNSCRNPNPEVNPSLWCFYGDNGEKPTLCSESGTVLFLNRTCNNPGGMSNLGRYDSRYTNLLEQARECYEDPLGSDYRGTHTESYCVNWPLNNEAKGLSTSHAYCRNPEPDEKESNAPWCYIEDGNRRYCNMNPTNYRRQSCPRVPSQAKLKMECFTRDDMADYRGSWTNYGQCDFWPYDDASKGVSQGHNFCRNPDEAPGGLWCYKNSYTMEAVYCDTREIKKFHRADCRSL